MTKRRGDRRGAFTVVELLVSVTLVLMLMGVAVFIFIHAVRIFLRTSSETQIYQAAHAAMERLRTEVQQCQPLLTSDGNKNDQQLVIAFDALSPVPPAAGPYFRYDALCFRTTTPVSNPAGQNDDRWVLYRVEGYDKAAGTPGTLMKYVSPDNGMPPCKADGDYASIKSVSATDPSPAIWQPAHWSPGVWEDGAEICQNVSFFGVEMFYDPDDNSDVADEEAIGKFFSDVDNSGPGIKSHPTYDTSLFNPYLYFRTAPTESSFFAIAAYTDATYVPAWNAGTRKAKLPSQLRITIRVRDEKGAEERTIQQQFWLPMAN